MKIKTENVFKREPEGHALKEERRDLKKQMNVP